MNYAQKHDLLFPFFIKVAVNKSKVYSFLITGMMFLQKQYYFQLECCDSIFSLLSRVLEYIIPDDWKTAYVTTLLKKGDRAKASNYRPVSLTSVCCKIIEHVIHSHVINHLERNNILDDKQHGFQKRRSCESQLMIWQEGSMISSKSTQCYWISVRHLTRPPIAD